MNLRSLVVPVVLAASASWADAVDVSLKKDALLGKGLPSVQIRILEPIAGFQLKLKRSDGKTLDVKGGGRPGVTRTIDLAQPEGKFHYAGELVINYPNAETASMPLEFDAALYGPLRMSLDKNKDVDIAGRKVRFTLNRPIAKAHVKVVLDSGRVLVDDDVLFNGEPEGKPVEVTWPDPEGKVFMVAVKPYDAEGFHTGVELFPWEVNIPHEEVNFDFGKWDVRPSEQEKLNHSHRLISEQVSKVAQWAEPRLYIVGHTDTVGTVEGNRTLSLNRAMSIGAYFRKRGLRIPIFYEGFGEEALLVSTGDEQQDERNRRAEYILAIDHPTANKAPSQPNWRKL